MIWHQHSFQRPLRLYSPHRRFGWILHKLGHTLNCGLINMTGMNIIFCNHSAFFTSDLLRNRFWWIRKKKLMCDWMTSVKDEWIRWIRVVTHSWSEVQMSAVVFFKKCKNSGFHRAMSSYESWVFFDSRLTTEHCYEDSRSGTCVTPHLKNK